MNIRFADTYVYTVYIVIYIIVILSVSLAKGDGRVIVSASLKVVEF